MGVVSSVGVCVPPSPSLDPVCVRCVCVCKLGVCERCVCEVCVCEMYVCEVCVCEVCVCEVCVCGVCVCGVCRAEGGMRLIRLLLYMELIVLRARPT